MIRPETLHFCAPNINSANGLNFDRMTTRGSRSRILVFAVLALLSFLISTPYAFAESKSKRASAKSETRARRTTGKQRRSEKRVVVNKRGAVNKRIGSDQRSVASKRRVADTKRSNVKLASKPVSRHTRQRVAVRVTPKPSVSARRLPEAPSVRSTVIVTPKQPNNQAATRPTLVNDIVIISEAREITASRGTGSSNNMPSIWPVAGAIRGGFGVRRNPFGGSSSEFHKGQDIKATYGAQVIATADGVVVLAGWLRGYGQAVYVDHGNGISTRYGHLSRIDVIVGQAVNRGDNLGLVGSTGRSTGPHLHYEVRIDGQATNPTSYLPSIPSQPATVSPASR